MSFVFRINGVDMPTPAHKGVGFQLSDIDSDKTDRNAVGVMRRERMRSNVVRIDVEYNYLHWKEYRKVINAISPTFFDVEYFDIVSGQVIKKRMYAGNITYNVYKDGMYLDLKFPLIER